MRRYHKKPLKAFYSNPLRVKSRKHIRKRKAHTRKRKIRRR